ncbi:MAG: hypothetical protein CL822_00665 [Crocinitomicaceae bacterium]|nr:hypothetical protein [Crocinitomicaceae bacterium]
MRTQNPTPMNTTRALFLTCACAAVSLSSLSQAAKTTATQPDHNPTETKADILLLDKWRHVGFHLISDWQGGEVDSVLDDPTFGFALTYMKHDRHGLLDGGFDIGFQPMGGFDTTAFVVQDGKAPLEGQLRVRNQLVHAHYLLRFTLFQRAKIQPFAEGFVGARGSLLGARFTAHGSDDFTPVNDVPFFSANFSYGYALGARVQVGERSFLTARYGEMRHLDGGNVVQVADADRLTIGPDGTVTSNATTGVTLPPYSVRVGLAINF